MPLYCLQTDADRFSCDTVIRTDMTEDCALFVRNQLADAKKRRRKRIAFALRDRDLLSGFSEVLLSEPLADRMQVYLLTPRTGAADRSEDLQRFMRLQRAVGTGAPRWSGGFKQVSPTAQLAELLAEPTETFSEMLLRLIDRAGLSDAECYKRACVSRQHFAKIRADRNYRPKKKTVLAFAIALQLDLSDTYDLLQTAGFTFSHSNRFDIVVEYYISRGIYDLAEINGALYDNGEELIGVD